MKSRILWVVFVVSCFLFLSHAGTVVTGFSNITNSGPLTGTAPVAPTLLFEATTGLGGATYSVPGVPMDLSTNRYIVEFSGAQWTNIASGNLMWKGNAGASYFYTRFESGLLAFYESDNNNGTTWSSTGSGSNNLFAGVSGTPYTIAYEMGRGQAHVIVNGNPLWRQAANYNRGMNTYRRYATTVPRPDPGDLHYMQNDIGNAPTALRIYRREAANINNLVLLGNSITAAQDAEFFLRTALGQSWLVYNNGMGYRQTREMKSAIITPYAGDAYNNPCYYADVDGLFFTGAAANWVLINCPTTNDLVYYNASVKNPGPESGGYTATDSINYVLGMITDIKANSPGWKVAVSTTMNVDSFNSGGSYATGEAMRQTFNTAVKSGTIAAVADRVIDLDNVFAPAASRTDNVNHDGPLYNAGYWPKYSDNTANFDAFHIHPLSLCYQVLYNYIAARMLLQ